MNLDEARLTTIIAEACCGLAAVDAGLVSTKTRRNLCDGIAKAELSLARILAARALIEQEPTYNHVTARLLLHRMRREVLTAVSRQLEQATQAGKSPSQNGSSIVKHVGITGGQT
ncbi:hypothetical protein [Pararhizobium haloflavum]|uniref:hypothetical protein n=1 Tax=Pararhizobium haloflavum TaxID=2037914 RepID=UPI0012FFF6BE|nr:hypothetical protein [Pararhizobium haloflavum]